MSEGGGAGGQAGMHLVGLTGLGFSCRQPLKPAARVARSAEALPLHQAAPDGGAADGADQEQHRAVPQQDHRPVSQVLPGPQQSSSSSGQGSMARMDQELQNKGSVRRIGATE